ncbi:hypothetical protein ACFOET_19505, partial [Parapedobacter deserti]
YNEIVSIINNQIVANSDALVDNGDGTFTHTAADGTVVTFDIPADVSAVNGLSIDGTSGAVTLGGALTEPTVLTTDATNTLAISGLGAGDAETNQVMSVDPSGVMQTLEVGDLAIEPWLRQSDAEKATENTDDIYIMGKVGIGTNDMLATANPDVMLAVNGAILTTNSIYADYVFEDYFEGRSELNADYNFKSLKDVEQFINENRHLPGITSINGLQKNENGDYLFNLSELSIQVLEKVEELYLHTIEQQRLLESKEEEIRDLRERVERLEKLLLGK